MKPFGKYQVGKSFKGPVAVLCCGCFGVLQNDGTTAEFDPAKGCPTAASFETADQADETAMSHGWTVIDGNHRCKKCSKYFESELEPRHHGAYLSVEALRGSAPGGLE